MTLPRLLLVDDSEAILAYERGALAAHYAITTAGNGQEALERIEAIVPDLVVLDLSMPVMDGEEVLRRCQADPRFAAIPFVVVSAEHDRARRCLGMGAEAFLPKPIRADELVAVIGRTLDRLQTRARQRSLAVLELAAGAVRLGIPLEQVHSVLPQLPGRPRSFGPVWLHRQIELDREWIDVLDVAHRLDVAPAKPLVDRKMVVVERARKGRLALAVDDVRDPIEVPEGRLDPAPGSPDAVLGIAATQNGPLPVIQPSALLSSDRLAAVRRTLCAATTGAP